MKIINDNKHSDAIAWIRWYKESEGGRKNLPTGNIFAANLRFENEETLWSVVIILPLTPPDDTRIQKVELGFLFRENLEKYLVPGRQFYISEGPKRRIAEGKIISIYV
jgi:hypothetical protein